MLIGSKLAIVLKYNEFLSRERSQRSNYIHITTVRESSTQY